MRESLRGGYRRALRATEAVPERLDLAKTRVAERLAVRKKRPWLPEVAWTTTQQKQFDAYWKKHYGRIISPRWHQLYQRVTGVFDPRFLPEILYSTKIEPSLVPRAHGRVLEDKSLLSLLYGEAGYVDVPETVLVGEANRLQAGSRRILTSVEASALLGEAGEVVAKPTVGSSSGEGVRFLDMRDGLDQATGQLSAVVMRSLGPNFIVQRRVKSHPDWAHPHPESVNTVRVTTFISSEGVHHWPVNFRMGVGGASVDNVHAGGVFVGVRDDGRAHSTGLDGSYRKIQAHPDTGVHFSGLDLPGLPDVLSAAYRLHEQTPRIGVMSWDFTLAPSGRPLLVEVNLRGQAVWFPQVAHGSPAFGGETEAVLGSIR